MMSWLDNRIERSQDFDINTRRLWSRFYCVKVTTDSMRCVCAFLLGVVALLGSVMGDDAPTCPQKTPVENYNCHSFHGTWYTLMRTHSNDFERGDTCSKAIIAERPNGTIAFTNKFVRPGESEYGTLEGNYWRTEELGTEGIAWINYPQRYGDWKSKYHILATDYTDFALTWSCWINKQGVRREHAWVMGRHPEITDALRQKAAEAAEAAGLDLSTFDTVSHENCPAE